MVRDIKFVVNESVHLTFGVVGTKTVNHALLRHWLILTCVQNLILTRCHQ